MRRYMLTVNAAQAEIIRDACELLARLRMGQFDKLEWLALLDMPRDAMDEFRRHARELEALLGDAYNTPRDDCGIRETAWDLYQVARHRLAWDNIDPNPEAWQPDTNSVQFREPRMTGTEPLAQIEEVAR